MAAQQLPIRFQEHLQVLISACLSHDPANCACRIFNTLRSPLLLPLYRRKFLVEHKTKFVNMIGKEFGCWVGLLTEVGVCKKSIR